jgi:hypothetical protein
MHATSTKVATSYAICDLLGESGVCEGDAGFEAPRSHVAAANGTGVHALINRRGLRARTTIGSPSAFRAIREQG